MLIFCSSSLISLNCLSFVGVPNREPNSKKNPGCSLDSLPTLEAKSTLNTIGSRKPISRSEAEALHGILYDGPFPLKSTNKYHESGYFSGDSKLSLCKTTLEKSRNHFIGGDEMGKYR